MNKKNRKKKRSLIFKIISAICSIALIASSIGLIIAEEAMIPMSTMSLSVVVISTSSFIAGGSLSEILFGVFEIFWEGLITLFECVIDFFSSIF